MLYKSLIIIKELLTFWETNDIDNRQDDLIFRDSIIRPKSKIVS